MLAWLCGLGVCGGPAWAQLGQKPSGYRPSGLGPPRTEAAPASLPRLTSRRDFDRLARVYDVGTPLALPHLLFVIDRARGDELSYIDSRRYALHQQFLQARLGLADLGPQALKSNYSSPQRRFLLGTLSWRAAPRQWVYEFWEGDQLTLELLALADTRLRATFFEPLRFKPNAAAQEAVAAQLQLPVLTQAELIAQQGFLPLNTGRAVGRLRVLDDAEAVDDLAPDEIVLLREVPLTLPPVAGVLTTRASTTLSHVNLLAKGWGIPNAWLSEPAEALALAGRWVALEVRRTGVSVRAAGADEVAQASASHGLRRSSGLGPAPDLRRAGLVPLSDLRQGDRHRCGSKAANLGALAQAQRQGALAGMSGLAPVPDGFCIPFASFAAFMAQPEVVAARREALATPGFDTDRSVRAQALARLREALQHAPLPEGLEAAWLAQWQGQLGQDGVFVRSSSNSEDLPGFSGAGLYTTVPNVRARADRPQVLADAVRTVWASVFNTEAWEARRWAGVPQDRVVMGVLVQRAIDARSAGVMSTLNPFDPQQPGMSYISAKRGLGIRVVEGRRQAEQLLYNRRNQTVQVLSRADDAVALLLDADGGVREQAVEPGRAVLSDALVRTLAQAGERVRQVLGPAPQDIEWATDAEGRVVLLQARPLVLHGPGERR